jgi:hypothetical protein
LRTRQVTTSAAIGTVFRDKYLQHRGSRLSEYALQL